MEYTDRSVLTAAAPNAADECILTVVGGPGFHSLLYYWIVTHYPVGSVLAGPYSVTNAPLPTSTTNYVVVQWKPYAGATGYDLLRTTTPQIPPDGSNCALALNLTTTEFLDQGGPLAGYSLSTLKYAAASVDGGMRLNNRDFREPILAFTPTVRITKIFYPDGTSQTSGMGGIVGPAGPPGPRGPAGTQGSSGPQGPVGPAGAQGLTGAKGPPAVIKGSVATSASLPTTGNHAGDAWIAQDTGHLWVWSGTAWTDSGTIKGPAGAIGPRGTTGPQGPAGPSGTTGATGGTGAMGTAGGVGLQGGTGPIGPTGPAGPTGPVGNAGPQGPVGPAGIMSGNAGGITNEVQWNNNGTLTGSAILITQYPSPGTYPTYVFLARGNAAVSGGPPSFDESNALLQLGLQINPGPPGGVPGTYYGGISADWMALALGTIHSFTLQLGTDDAVKPGTSTWWVTSDIRLKTDVRPFEDGLSTLKQIKPIQYQFNGKANLPEDKAVGLDAAAHQDILPDCVSTIKGTIDGVETDIYTFNSHALFFVLINSLRELAERLEDLEVRKATRA